MTAITQQMASVGPRAAATTAAAALPLAPGAAFSWPLPPKIEQIVRLDVEALVLEGVEDKGAHRHVRVGCEEHQLLAQALAQRERELDDRLTLLRPTGRLRRGAR